MCYGGKSYRFDMDGEFFVDMDVCYECTDRFSAVPMLESEGLTMQIPLTWRYG